MERTKRLYNNFIMQLFVNTLVEFSLISLGAIWLYFMHALVRSFYLTLASFFSVGGYILYLVFKNMGYIFIGILAGGIAGGVVAILLERFLFKHFYKKNSSSLVLLMVYFSVFLLFSNLIGLIFGNDMKFLGVSPKVISLPGVNITLPQVVLIVSSLGFLILISAVYNFSKIGLKIRALGQDGELAQVLGIDIYKYRYAVATASGFSLGVLGAIYTWDIGMEPYLSFSILLYSMVAFIVGGVNSFLGAVAGSFIIAFLKNVLSLLIPIYFVDVIVYSTLFVMLIFRPYGLFGDKVRVEES